MNHPTLGSRAIQKKGGKGGYLGAISAEGDVVQHVLAPQDQVECFAVRVKLFVYIDARVPPSVVRHDVEVPWFSESTYVRGCVLS